MVHFNKSKKQLLIMSLIFGAFLFPGCWQTAQEPKLMVINVLDKDYFDDCHIKGSVHIPFSEINDRMRTLDKKNHYVLYCSDQACTSSTFNMKAFVNAGFENVWDYVDGMAGWYQAGLPYEGPARKDYLMNEGLDFGDDASEPSTISTQELYSKMQEFGLL